MVHINALEPAKILNELLILPAKVEAIRTGHSGLASIRPFEVNLDCFPIVSIHGLGRLPSLKMIYYVINHLQVDLFKSPQRLRDLPFSIDFDQHFVLARSSLQPLAAQGLDIVNLRDIVDDERAVAETITAMEQGAHVIAQGR